MGTVVLESSTAGDTRPTMHNVDIILENYDLYVTVQCSPVTAVQTGVRQMGKRI